MHYPRGHGFPIGWSRCIYYMVQNCAEYAWRATMLAQLYHDIHIVVDKEYASLFEGVTLLHIWSWEHILVT